MTAAAKKDSYHKFLDNNQLPKESTGESVVTFEDVPSNTTEMTTVATAATSQHVTSKKAVVENTYRMEPNRRFPVSLVEAIMSKILNVNLSDRVYDANESPHLAKALSSEIKKRVMDLKLKRYKIIMVVNIGQKNGQRFISASRFLWDNVTDNFASVSYENRSLFAIACVFATYYE